LAAGCAKVGTASATAMAAKMEARGLFMLCKGLENDGEGAAGVSCGPKPCRL